MFASRVYMDRKDMRDDQLFRMGYSLKHDLDICHGDKILLEILLMFNVFFFSTIYTQC